MSEQAACQLQPQAALNAGSEPPTHLINTLQGYAYVNYSTCEMASEAVAQLNGIEFPPNSGHRIKVLPRIRPPHQGSTLTPKSIRPRADSCCCSYWITPLSCGPRPLLPAAMSCLQSPWARFI